MMTCESSTKLRSMRTPISLGVEIEVCAWASHKVHIGIHERDCVRRKMKPSKRPAHLGNGKLAEGASSHWKASEEGRVAGYPAH